MLLQARKPTGDNERGIMVFMNEYEIEETFARFNRGETPVLAEGATCLYRLMGWTNENSDGWPYWSKPSRAAQKLQTLLQSPDRFDPQDVTPAALKAACTPIKAFLTRQDVDHSAVFGTPAPAATPTMIVARTVGELRDALADYPSDLPLDVWLKGEDRLSEIEVHRETGETGHVWPSIVCDFS